MDAEKIKDVFSYKNLNAKGVGKSSLASIASRSVETAETILDACTEISKELEEIIYSLTKPNEEEEEGALEEDERDSLRLKCESIKEKL